MHPRAAVVLALVVACSSSKAGDTTAGCVLLDSVRAQCPPDWTAALAAKDAFCAKAMPDFDAFVSTGACRGRLRYTRHLFDGGPRYCLYDPSTLQLTGYGAFDGKAMSQQWTCAVDRADFDDQGCAGLGCPPMTDGGGVTIDAATIDGPANNAGDAPVPTTGDGALNAIDGPSSRPDAWVEVRCDLVEQTCGEGTRCEFFCDANHLVVGCDAIPVGAAGEGESCESADGGPSPLCGKGFGCFTSAQAPARCYRYCRNDSQCRVGTTCDVTDRLAYFCGAGGDIPAGICR